MKVDFGYCHCGCGEKTQISKRTRTNKGHIKGQPIRFINGHNSKGELNPHWKNGWIVKGGRYRMKVRFGKPIFEHRERAEKAMGKRMPNGACVHHHSYGEGSKSQLVVCNDHSYHMLLHARTRAFYTCGNAYWEICKYCRKYDNPSNLNRDCSGNNIYHKECAAKYMRERRKKLTQRRRVND